MTVPALHDWADNADLIANGARPLGYITDDDLVWDPTYGMGAWWTLWRPRGLLASDIDPAKSPVGHSVDFTAPPWSWEPFDVIAFDPPYKLNGTPTDAVDGRYGCHVVRTWQQRHDLIIAGLAALAPLLWRGGRLLLKCQDQVCSGEKRWQTRIFPDYAEQRCGLRQIDRLDMSGHTRPQPMNGRTQKRAHGHPSSLLVFERVTER
jgi:hypothetical protein